MIPAITPFLTWCLTIAMVMLFVAFGLVIVRVLRGPTTADRIIAIDLFGVLAVAFIALYTLYVSQVVFLDAAIALALVAFFGTVAYARFLERRVVDRPEEREATQKEKESPHA
ncbi:pH regulation protein F [Niveispirillum sp. SYP-B3756]|uniref:monovalent cation/H+ antiporter complex subunit F n=1 Tax=Niveispirillum sp. SYP-B3756 TaxID=2662178 RepID=UPI001290923E|nr:cation:proton antiporter [Niveispirillum sp. SYP-B3756]MQP66361.1 pH regulation protein F [Niveispirillum sp. SYP-B3756]